MGDKTNIFINFILVIISTFVFLSVTELSFRFIASADSDRPKTGFVIEDPDLVWKLKPQSVEGLKTNALGLRDFPYNENAYIFSKRTSHLLPRDICTKRCLL